MTTRLVLCVAVLLALPSVARADLIRLKNGRVISVESWQIKGETIVMVFRDGGGELEAPQSVVEEVLADEYPRLKPAPPQPVIAEAPAPADDIPTMIDVLAERYGVDPKLAHAVVRVESNYKPRAVSPKGARGLMQLMPATAQQYGVEDSFDPGENLEAGLRHLRGLLDRYRNDVRTALAAYNAGVFAVAKYGGVPPYRETQDYVRRIMTLAR
jgi:soluble lytic murein transglycosylase-like protein